MTPSQNSVSPPDSRLASLFGPSPRHVARFGLMVFAGAELGRLLSFPMGGFTAAIWPPTGLLLTALLCTAPAAWPRLVASAVAGGLVSDLALHGVSPMVSLAVWTGTVIHAFAGAWMLRRLVGAPFRCATPVEVLGLVFLGGIVSGALGAAVTAALMPGVRFLSQWRIAWCGGEGGVLVVVPLLLMSDEPHDRALGRRGRLMGSVERIVVLTLLLAVTQGTFYRPERFAVEVSWRFPYLVLVPFLSWICVRSAPRSAAIACALVAVLAAWHTTHSYAPLLGMGHTPTQRALLFRVFLSGIVLTTLLISTVITERRAAERALRCSEAETRRAAALQRAILDAANSSIISVDSEGTIRTFNATAERWLGYSASEVVGLRTPAFIHDPDEMSARAVELSAELGRAVDPGLEVFVARVRDGGLDEHEWTYIRRDGSRFPVRLSITALRDAEGTITGFLGIAWDITEKKLAEAALRRAHDDAMAAVRAKGEFLANMSHEIRTPLNGVIGMTELLLASPLNDLQRDYAQIIHGSGVALLTVINDILDFSKMDAGKMRLQTASFDLRTLLEEVADLLAPRAHQKGLVIAGRVDPLIPAGIMGDAVRIRQVLTNLAGNAVKFTDQGEVSLEARLVEESADALNLRIIVRDTGIGIAEKHHREIFDSFTQVDGGSDRKHGGTGLGLAICRRLVALMNGTIGVESTPGVGSTFWFEVKVGKAEPAAEPPAPAGIDGLRVLVVDDQPTNRAVLADALESSRCRADEAGSGAKALQRLADAAAEGDPYGLVLVGQGLPGDGVGTARAIKSEPALASVPLVLLTSLGAPRSGALHEPGLFFATLTLPVRRASLHALLCRLAAKPTASPGSSGPARDRPLAVPLRILLVEDNEVNRKVSTGMLEWLGCAAVAVGNGCEAIEALDGGGYDLVLMDVQMPDMDGVAATRAIRDREIATGRHVPILAMTAHAMKGDRERCLAGGMDGYLTKPLRLEPLRDALAHWADARVTPLEPAPTRPANAPSLFDLDRVRESCSGDSELTREVLGILVDTMPARLERLEVSGAAGDVSRIAWEAHSLKGVFLAVGSDTLAASFHELMQRAEREDPAGMTATLATIRDQWEQFRHGASRSLDGEAAVALLARG